jgi:hypothetical protein
MDDNLFRSHKLLFQEFQDLLYKYFEFIINSNCFHFLMVNYLIKKLAYYEQNNLYTQFYLGENKIFFPLPINFHFSFNPYKRNCPKKAKFYLFNHEANYSEKNHQK